MAPSRHILRRYLGVAGALILLLSSSPSLLAQEKSNASDTESEAIPGMVRVKISRALFQETMDPSFFLNAAARYEIRKVSPWLDRNLLRYIERQSGLYRRNGEVKDGLGGMGYETPAHSLMRIVIVQYSAQDSPEEVARALEAIPGVEYAEPIWRHILLFTPNDPELHREELKRWHLAVISAYDAWDEVRGDSSIVVAITDTGIERDHADLKNAIWHNPGESGDNKENNDIDDDGNGLVDDWWGYDFAGSDGNSPDNDPSPGQNDHGVHVAGIVGASGDNDIGVAGVGFGVRLMAVKISDDDTTPSLPEGFNGILYAAAMGADVINCSWGAPKRSAAEQAVINFVVQGQGIPVVAAAGNDGIERLRYPAGYDNVLSVTATRENDARYSRSNYHYNADICAPGESIYSTLDGSSYGYLNGTSMAAPMISAAAALLLKKDPTLTPVQISEVLRATSDNIELSLGSQYSGKMGSGRLNLRRAVETMTSIASARMTSYVVEEENPDGIIEPGEELTVRSTVENLLAPSAGVTTSMSPVDPLTLQIDGADVDLGPMGSAGSATTPPGTFRFTVPAGAAPDSRIVLKVTTRAIEGHANVDHVVLNVFPTYATTELNKISSTFNSIGNVGYNGMNREQGDGFFFEQEGSLLWHGGLMIGTAEDRLIDVVRRGESSEGTNDGFLMVEPYRLERDLEGRIETGRTLFTDKHQVLGLDVKMTSYEYRDDSNFLIVAYEVINKSGAPIENLRCGLYLDWDFQTDGKGDQASYDADNKMGFVRNRDNTDLLVGTALLSDQTPLYYAVNNFDVPVASNFTNQLKWSMLSSGITVQNTPPNVDVSMVIGGGPVRIEAGESETFVFGLMGARSFAELRETVERARAVSDVPDPKGPIAAVRIQASPNPFNDETFLTVRMPAVEDVRLEIFDLHGKSVGLLHEGRLESGDHSFRFDSSNLPSGVYFFRLRGETTAGDGQVILVR